MIIRAPQRSLRVVKKTHVRPNSRSGRSVAVEPPWISHAATAVPVLVPCAGGR